jgi:ricin-type beta-trefoil lectin protein
MNGARRAALGVLCALTVVATAVFAGGSPALAGPDDHVGTAPVSGGYFYLSNDQTGLCMEVAPAADPAANGLHVWQNYCSVTWRQQFQLVSIGPVNGVAAWRVKPRYNLAKCLDVVDGRTVAGQPLQIWQCSNGWQQMYQMVDVPNGPTYHKYQLEPVYNHWCVNVHDLGALANLIEYPCQGDARSRWVLSY